MSTTIHACQTCFYPMHWVDSIGWSHIEPGVYWHHAAPLSVCPQCGHSVGQIIDGRCVRQHSDEPFSRDNPCGCDWQIPAPDPAARKLPNQSCPVGSR